MEDQTGDKSLGGGGLKQKEGASKKGQRTKPAFTPKYNLCDTTQGQPPEDRRWTDSCPLNASQKTKF